MKRFIVWLLAIAMLGVLALGVGAYFAYRAAQPAIQSARDYLKSFGQLDEIDKRVANTERFAGPANGELSADQVERFARVQHSVRAALGQRIGAIEAKYRHLKLNVDDQPPAITDVASALSELSNVVLDARRMQVDALNQEKFSAAEDEWVRTKFYQAAGVTAVSRRLVDVEKLVPARTSLSNIPEKNRALVQPMMRFVDDWLPLAFLGL